MTSPRSVPMSSETVSDKRLTRIAEGIATRLDARVAASPAIPALDGGDSETSSSRNDDLVAASALYQCDECIAEEREFSCHQIEDVVIVNGKVVCKECVAEFYPKARTERAPDIAKKLRRQRMSVAQQQKRASAAESRVQSLEEEVKVLREALKPFAEYAPYVDMFVKGRAAQGGSPLLPTKHFRLSHFQAASAALKENGNG